MADRYTHWGLWDVCMSYASAQENRAREKLRQLKDIKERKIHLATGKQKNLRAYHFKK